MSDLSVKIGLAIFAFILGLLATFITATMQQESSIITYAILEEAIIDIRANNKDKLTKYYSKDAKNVSKYIVNLDNVGESIIKDFNSLIVGGEDSEIESYTIRTHPEREIVFQEEPQEKKNELRIKKVTLDVGQSIIMELIVVSDKKPIIKLYFSGGGGGVEWRKVAEPSHLSLQENFIKLFSLLVALIILPGLVSGIPKAIAFFFYGISRKEENESRTPKIAMAITSSELIASLIRYYILFLMLAPFSSVAKDITGLLERDTENKWTVNQMTEGQSSPVIISEDGNVSVIIEPQKHSANDKE
jgi:hypothetical protein